MNTPSLGALLHAFLADELPLQKGLRPTSIKAHRDALRLFLTFLADDVPCRLSQITLDALTLDRVLRFLQHLEDIRHNHRRTRNHRLTILHTFFEFLGRRVPECLAVAQQVAAIPSKRVPPPETRFLDRDEISTLFRQLPAEGRRALRDRALLLMLYNSGGRVQELADLQVEHLELGAQPRVRLHGKGDKWRICPLWEQTAKLLKQLVRDAPPSASPARPVFASQSGRALTRFGIYKIVRRHTGNLRASQAGPERHHISPHVFRHSCAVSLLEAGVDVNVIRGWLGHVRLDTTNRYAEITVRTKEAALRLCEPPPAEKDVPSPKPVWRDDEALLAWLASL
ncbi:MAG TPA: tyrosine-type recombinase/integrase [Burkholderiales bacterium]|nr:tyrosine-type recombinase/integrase [Burkholderiales bacterium]